VSSPRPWRFQRQRLEDVLGDWVETHRDVATDRPAVNESLMDLISSPLTSGRPDPHHDGVWELRVPGTALVITYVPDVETKTVWLVSLG
jgi:hypothetical protein